MMPRRSPTLEGFRAILSRPSVGLAEIVWRWSFGAAVALLVGFACFEYLDTLLLSGGDLLLLRTAQPVLVSQAIQHIFRGSAWRVIETAAVLALTLGIVWVVVASLARAATMRALLAYFHQHMPGLPEKKTGRLGSLLALNSFRL